MINKINKKAFTLIELLAVIVVLAIILVIAVPRVMSVIENSRKEAFRLTGEQLIKGAKDRLIYDMDETIEGKTYTIVDGVFVGDSIPMTGELPDNGTIYVTKEGATSIAVSKDDYCIRKYEEEENVFVSKDPDCELHIPEVVADSCFYITTGGSQVTITGYDTACSLDVIIPSVLNGFPVTKIENKAFENDQLTSVTIPNSVTIVGESAFSYNKLTRAIIPTSVTTIGRWAFMSNQLISITIPNSVTSLGRGSFNNNQLPDSQAFIYARNIDGSDDLTIVKSYGGAKRNNVVIPSNVTTIYYFAFEENQLTSVTIPNTVTTINYGAFNNNQMSEEQAFIYARNPDGSENKSIIMSYGGAKRDNAVIPNTVTTIEEYALSYLELTSVTISNGLTSIGYAAFYDNQLTNVIIPASVTSIGDWAFSNNQLASVTISNGVTSIGYATFNANQLTNVIIPASVTSIGDWAFDDNQLTNISIPSNVPISNNSISSTFYTSYVTVNTRAAGTYTAPSQTGLWVKQS